MAETVWVVIAEDCCDFSVLGVFAEKKAATIYRDYKKTLDPFSTVYFFRWKIEALDTLKAKIARDKAHRAKHV